MWLCWARSTISSKETLGVTVPTWQWIGDNPATTFGQ